MSSLRKALLPSVAVLLCTLPGLAEAATWIPASGGDWSIGSNWDTAAPPNGVDQVASFIGDTLDGTNNDWDITNVSGTVGTLLFQDTGPSANSGWELQSGSLTMDVSSGSALINFRESMPEIQIPITLNDDLDITYTWTTANHRANLNQAIGSGTGLTTNVDINRFNPFGTGNYGRVVLYGNNTFNGDVTVHNGNLQIGSNDAIPNASDLDVKTGAMLTMIGSETINALNGGGTVRTHPGFGTCTLTVGAGGGTGSFSGIIRDDGTGITAVTKTGAGTQTLGGANTYTGATTVSAGTLLLGDPSALGSATSAIQLCDAGTGASDVALLTDTWGTSGYLTYTRDINVNNLGSGTVTIGSNAAGSSGRPVEFTGTITLGRDVEIKSANVDRTSFGGKITGAGGVEIIGPHRVTFASSASDYAGDTVISGGSLQLYSDAVPATSDVYVNSAGGFLLWSTSATIDGLYGTGPTRVGGSSRTLTVGSSGANGDYSGALGEISGGQLSLVKTGTGTQILRGSSTYSGTTTVDDGTLLVNNTTGSGTGSGDVTVDPDGTLGGYGFLSGEVDLLGTIAPGDSVGTLSTGSETWATDGIYEWEISDVDDGAGTGWDFLSITGTLTIDATASDPFVIGVRSLTPGGAPGPVADFEGEGVYSWPIATASGGLVGYDESKFSLVTGSFQNGTQGGRWFVSVNQENDTLFVNYAIPEPSAFLLAALGLLMLGPAGWRRRRIA